MSEMKSPKPFHTVVVTSPDKRSAEAASSGPLNKYVSEYTRYLQDVNVYSTSDPFDTRMGSGGGTLAALDFADRNNYPSITCSSEPTEQQQDEYDKDEGGSVLIIHAGGQSSRCPTQITLGKAWTSLPTANDTLTNPTYLLIESLSKVLAELPSGSVVVAASDVLLSLPMKSPIKFDCFIDDCDKVLGLAVPAPLQTAVNHGVFVLGENGDENKDCGSIYSDDNASIRRINAFLQKPSIDDMEEFTSGKDMAWIDTGVIVFLPSAAKALRKMMNDDLSLCTKVGLEKLYQKQHSNHTHGDGHSIHQFAKENSVKVELYSHLLLAISTKGSKTFGEKRRLENYLANSMNKDLDSELLIFIFQSLAKFELQVCIIPNGAFIHLGTSSELSTFLIHGSGAISSSDREHNDREFGKRIGLTKESQLTCDGISLRHCVALNSSFSAAQNDRCSIGPGTVVEHCRLRGSFSIGSNCLVSGLRGKWNIPMKILDNFVCQIVKLQENWMEILGLQEGNKYGSYVCIYHNIHDAIKAQSTCYGVPFQNLLLKSGLKSSDLWNDEKQQLLWNAKINPIFQHGYLDWSIFSWVENMTIPNSTFNESSKASLDKWKMQQRISLAQLRSVADASFEFSYRVDCQSIFKMAEKVRSVLLTRRNEELNTSIVLFDNDALTSTLKALDSTIIDSMNDGSIDICSRAFMLISTVLTSLSEDIIMDKPAEKGFNRRDFLTEFRSATKKSQVNACQKILLHRDHLLSNNPSKSELLECAETFEEAAHQLTKECVATGVSVTSTRARPQAGTWVLAEAPARVDLSGGWSDTPPISYEFGGKVACLAVSVNKKKPLSSRCRLVVPGSGILLTTQSRNIDTNELVQSDSVYLRTVKDISDYNDPSASCALLKCALLIYGLLPTRDYNIGINNDSSSLQPYLDKFCRLENVGLEIISTSKLPKGSGLGSSSILAGCILACIGKCLGLGFGEDKENNGGLTKAILLLEQLLTTGGGWQDQVGGMFGGLKLGKSEIHHIPMVVNVQKFEIPTSIINELNERMVLMFTGQPRLAKNILRNVLRQWASRKETIVHTVKSLVNGAHESIEAVKLGNIDRLGSLLSSYWAQKKAMAGEQSGVEPPVVQKVINLLYHHNLVVGATLCGAGGGGFLLAITKKDKNVSDLRKCLQCLKEAQNFLWYDCDVCEEGLTLSEETA